MQAHLQPRALSLRPRTPHSRCRADTAGVISRLQSRRRPLGAPVSASSHYRQAGVMTNSNSEGPEFTFRTVFISDIHLGTPQAQATLLLPFLQKIRTEKLYLVGDIIDGWKLKSKWYWPESHGAILRQLLEMANACEVIDGVLLRQANACEVIYMPGNHDEAVRTFLTSNELVTFGKVKVVMETVHHAADGRRFLVMHGDRCDTTVHLSHAVTRFLGDVLYDIFVTVNILIKGVRRLLRLPYWSLAAHVHSSSKFAAQVVDRYELALAAEARKQGMDGVICGHIHYPHIRRVGDVLYMNDGDWVDSCSALVEDAQGRMDILHWMDHFSEPAEAASAAEGSPEASDTESVVSLQASLLFDVLKLDVPAAMRSPPREAHGMKQ